jgi:hypothetical protein
LLRPDLRLRARRARRVVEEAALATLPAASRHETWAGSIQSVSCGDRDEVFD